MKIINLENEENKYITWVKNALSDLLLHKKYMVMCDKKLVTERNFCMVLAALIYKNNYEEMERGLDGKPFFISGEVSKNIFDKDGKKVVQPDFVIHQSNNPADGLKQLLIAEVKIKECSKDAYRRDIKKLSEYKRQLGFQNALYIVINNTAEEIKSIASSTKDVELKNMCFMVVEDINNVIINTLYLDN